MQALSEMPNDTDQHRTRAPVEILGVVVGSVLWAWVLCEVMRAGTHCQGVTVDAA